MPKLNLKYYKIPQRLALVSAFGRLADMGRTTFAKWAKACDKDVRTMKYYAEAIERYGYGQIVRKRGKGGYIEASILPKGKGELHNDL